MRMLDSREMFQHLPFPFPDGVCPSQLGAVVQRTVLRGDEPAREVIHTADGSWLISDGVNDPNQPGAVVATHISHAIKHSSSIASLADMPPGQITTRRGPGQPWIVDQHHWPEDKPER
jgi:hypothetical protein